jgi:outer membrane PBP1 activator LpoA protein
VHQLPALLFVILLLTACTGIQQHTTPVAADALQQSAQSLLSQGDYQAAAQLYLSEAETAPENQRPGLRLSACELLAAGGLWPQLEAQLHHIDPARLSTAQNQRYRLLDAQLAVHDRQPERALQLLGQISSPETLPDQGRHYYQLRAAAYELAGNPLEAARQLTWLDGLLSDPQAKLDNQYRLWEQLSGLSSDSLRAMQTSPPPDALSGWMQLVLITREYRADRDRWSSELDQWRDSYPHHSAENALLNDLLHQLGQFAAQANQIAVLLPFSGNTADAADAIRDGLLAAFFHGESPRPQLRFYDTGDDSQLIRSLYQRAIDDGADFVIGPLLKADIEQLANSGHLPVPVLALNHSSEGEAGNAGLPLYQFGLAPEDEARSVAERAYADGHPQMIALVPDNAWGKRVLAAFNDRLGALGGELLASSVYPENSADYSSAIQQVLNIDASEQRHQALQRLMGKNLEFEPRRRQDAQAILVLAFPQQARQINPQLRFHHAGDLPVYSTSHVYQPGTDAAVDRDMDGLMFCDMPWTLDTQGSWSGQRAQIQAIWPDRGEHDQRLFALGFDAYQIVPWLVTLRLPGFSYFPGATGVLSLDANKLIHRELEWARFSQGIPEKFMSTEGQDEPETHWR